MNEKQIQSLEKQFATPFPLGYRQLLLQPPPLLEAVLKHDAKQNPGQTPVFLNAGMIRAVNEMMRDPEDEDFLEFDPNDPDRPWPNRYMIIGSDVGGNFYCIAPGTGKSRVYFCYQGGTSFSRYADDMTHFVKRVFQSYGVIAGMDCESDDTP